MKKIFLILILGSIAVPAYAASHAGFKVGLALNRASVSGTYSGATADSTTGFLFGAFLDHDFARVVTGEIEISDRHVSGDVGYITIPVRYKAKFRVNSRFVPFFALGPEFDFKLRGDAVAKSFFISGNFGAGTEYWLSKSTALLLDIRYTLGLTSAAEATVAGTTVSAKSHSFQVLGGMAFPL